MYYTTALLFTHRVSADRDADQNCARSRVCEIAGRLEVCVRIGRCALWHCGIEARSEGTGEKGSLQLGPADGKNGRCSHSRGEAGRLSGQSVGSLTDRAAARRQGCQMDAVYRGLGAEERRGAW